MLSLLWRGSRDGFYTEYFHSRCDGKPRTLTIIKTTAGYIFGGYTSKAWASPKNAEYKEDPHAFLFSFKNPSDTPLRLNVVRPQYAVYHRTDYGPTFGYWHDLHICEGSNIFKRSYIYSQSYELTKGRGLESARFFYGDDYFRVADIEVFEVV